MRQLLPATLLAVCLAVPCYAITITETSNPMATVDGIGVNQNGGQATWDVTGHIGYSITTTPENRVVYEAHDNTICPGVAQSHVAFVYVRALSGNLGTNSFPIYFQAKVVKNNNDVASSLVTQDFFDSTHIDRKEGITFSGYETFTADDRIVYKVGAWQGAESGFSNVTSTVPLNPIGAPVDGGPGGCCDRRARCREG